MPERSRLLISRFEHQSLLFACSCNCFAASAHAPQEFELANAEEGVGLTGGHAHAPRAIITNGTTVAQVM